MANSNRYKTYQRERRTVDVQARFDGGMKYTNGAVDEGFLKMLVNYDLSNDGVYLIPRPGLRVKNIISPDWTVPVSSQVLDNTKRLIACKECAESDGKVYRQFVLAQTEEDTSKIYFVTSDISQDQEEIVEYIEADGYKESDIAVGISLISPEYSAKARKKELDEIHHIPIVNSNAFDVVGSFAFNNSYYWFNDNSLYSSVFQTDRYVGQAVPVKTLNPIEAVSYGYNMLSANPYTFVDNSKAGKIELTGILPYVSDSDHSFSELQMTPKANETLDFRCYFNGEIGRSYKFVWEWRTVNDSRWTEIQDLATAPTYTVVSAGDGKVKLQDSNSQDVTLYQTFKVPSKEIMVRVQAFDVNQTAYVEEAMTMGFDFTPETYGAGDNVKQENYDLSAATGMTCWRNRLVLFGVQKDPTILFISDLNEPGFFPYPNNITIFNDPIIHAVPYMGDLLVFTTTEIHRISLGSDGLSFVDDVVQTNLYIKKGDVSFIQVVKNMVFFKSGNYFYMMVPKSQAATGTLTLAPVSNNILELFNKFESSLYTFLMEVYDFSTPVQLYDYYNYLDYDDIHNTYVFKYTNPRLMTEGYLYFDLIYDTNLRSWRTYMFEALDHLMPYRFDATQRGVLTGLTGLTVGDTEKVMFMEFFEWDNLNVSDFRIFPDNDFVFPGNTVNEWTVEQKEALKTLFEQSYFNSKEKKTFFNWQFLDTGLRNDLLPFMKRYREIQVQFNNVDGVDLEFGMDFYLDNEMRMRWYKYEVEHITDVDPEDARYGQLYLTRVMEPNIKIGSNTTALSGSSELGSGGRPWEVDKKRVWKLEQSKFPELSLWKVRMPVSGKGAAPRMKLVSHNDCRYELMSVNWVCRVMNAR